MDLSTNYLGLSLPHPFMCGASPLADTMDGVKKLEDAGSAAIVLRSLFEEQIEAESQATQRSIEEPAESFAEATSYFPRPDEFVFGPHEYLEQIRKIKAAVSVPVIASLNGSTPGGWLDYAELMQDAGADALELNVYFLATDPNESGNNLVQQTIDMVGAVKKSVNIPVAVKLSPYYSSVANVSKRLDEVGADGLILFNRFYQPDIDVEQLEVVPSLSLSNSGSLLLRLRWLAILSGRIKADLAVTGGVHTALDAVKAIMCGAHAIQSVSALLDKGITHLKSMREDLAKWLQKHEYESLKQMQGSMGLTKCPDSKAFERANYMHVLQSWSVG